MQNLVSITLNQKTNKSDEHVKTNKIYKTKKQKNEQVLLVSIFHKRN